MKFLILLAFFAFAAAEMNDQEKACAKKTNFNTDAGEALSRDLTMNLDEPRLKPFIFCVYQSYGMIAPNHKISWDILRSEMKVGFGDDADASVDHCKKNVVLVDDDQENSFLVTKCMSDLIHQ